MTTHDQAGALDELIDEIERAEPAAVDTSSAAAVVDSILNSVVPWLLCRVGRINAALMILVTVPCVNFLGDGLRDAFDPKARK